MRALLRRLHTAPRPVRWVARILAVCVALWPQFVLAAEGQLIALNAILVTLIGSALGRRAENSAIRTRTGWEAEEARERVADARRGIVPDDERSRSRLRFLLDRELSNAKGLPWLIGGGSVLLAGWVVVFGLLRDLPVFAVVGGLWYLALGALVVPPALRSSRTDKVEVREALRLLGDSDP